jgi:hypothetical protein
MADRTPHALSAEPVPPPEQTGGAARCVAAPDLWHALAKPTSRSARLHLADVLALSVALGTGMEPFSGRPSSS